MDLAFRSTRVEGHDAMTSPPGEEPEASLQLASGSDVGQVRSANEDSCDTFARADGTQLLVVADGMGGARGGATASQTAVATIADAFETETSARPGAMLETAIRSANTRVFEMAQQNPELEGMGTTVVAFLLDPRLRGTVAHVGDSRAYRYRRGRLEPITTDHSVVAEMQRRGLLSADEAAVHPRRNEILRAVGVLAEVEVEIADIDVAPGDRFLLCSDGLSGVVQDDEIAAVVQTESPDDAVVTLIRMANERGGPDNITVQILSIPASEADGDPEATAPVELSTVGIEAIESKRRQRKRTRQIAFVIACLVACIGAYFLWQFLHPGPDGGTASASPEATEARAAVIGTTPESRSAEMKAEAEMRDQFEIEIEPPRRGVPRDDIRR
jgi:serine/threonine protein phosphatase PrpC